MRKFLRHYLIFVLVIFLVAAYLPGLSYGGDIRNLLISALILTLIHLLVKPLVTLISLPINILTLGLFSFFINALMLYIATRAIPNFRVSAFYFPAITWNTFILDSFYIPLILSYVVIAFFISVLRNFFLWLCSK